jgi:hypothetical protein
MGVAPINGSLDREASSLISVQPARRSCMIARVMNSFIFYRLSSVNDEPIKCMETSPPLKSE